MAGRGGNSPTPRAREYLEGQAQNRQARLDRQNAADSGTRRDNADRAARDASRAARSEAARERETARRTNVPATQSGGSGPPANTGGRSVVPAGGERLPATGGSAGVPAASSGSRMPELRLPAGSAGAAARGAGYIARAANPALGAASILMPTQAGSGSITGNPELAAIEGVNANDVQPLPYPPPPPPEERRPDTSIDRGNDPVEPHTVIRAAGTPARRAAPRATSRMSEADELNQMSLDAIRGQPARDDPRDRNIRRAMGMAKGGKVECYAKGGAVGGAKGASRHDGMAKTGRTKCKFF